MLRIAERIEETPTITTLRFREKINAKPGQFAMVWIPGVNEKPFSFSYLPSIGITIRDIGPFSHKLCSLSVGDKIGIRGPFGRGFEVKGKKILIIGGGVGISPLAPLIKKGAVEFTAIIGARTKSEILFKDRIERYAQVIITTNDGSCGIKGYVTAALDIALKKDAFDQILCCGPKPMIREIIRAGEKFRIPVQASIEGEGYMKCGIGLCGSCTVGPLRVCKDGPVFDAEEIKEFISP